MVLMCCTLVFVFQLDSSLLDVHVLMAVQLLVDSVQAVVTSSLPTFTPGLASQRLSMARYATSTATEIQTQRDSNPVPTSASRLVCIGM